MFPPNYRLIDLTHPLNSSVPTWDDSCGFNQHLTSDYPKPRVQKIEMHAGIGTHIDAPSHFISNGATVADIPLEKLIVPINVINISEKADEDYLISPDDIFKFENIFGEIEKNSLVIAYTGWSKYWNEPKKYRNEDSKSILHFPSFSQAAAELLTERDIAGIGIDTLSPDSADKNFPVHYVMLGKGKYIIENIANAYLLPPKNAYAISLPLRIQHATESPLRMIALLSGL